MHRITRSAKAALSFCLPALVTASTAMSQGRLGPPQAYPQTAAPAGAQSAAQAQVAPLQQEVAQQTQQQPVNAPPQGFKLNQLQQAELDQVLDTWQKQSSAVTSFRCEFERWEYDMAFSPTINNQIAPLNKNRGELSYNKPDKGSFEIKEINTFQQEPAPAGQQPPAPGQAPAIIKGDWVTQPNAIGEHWVSDGVSIYEYRSQDKQVVERPIPPQMRGQAIVDGPLPFLFGAEAAKLKQRYWMRILHAPEISEEQDTQDQVWLLALPKMQEQAADFREVRVIFDRQQMLPKAMQITLPNKNRHSYIFNLNGAKANQPGNWLKELFVRPHTPWGWKHVVENMPVAQAPQEVPQKR